mmetsp:Transcript_29781/g.86404  ORF Transcript_29781/g.86404 Transcript_29781/m.86404 type:complete len:254 (-) Transcript_29781:923-1684(-)
MIRQQVRGRHVSDALAEGRLKLREEVHRPAGLLEVTLDHALIALAHIHAISTGVLTDAIEIRCVGEEKHDARADIVPGEAKSAIPIIPLCIHHCSIEEVIDITIKDCIRVQPYQFLIIGELPNLDFPPCDDPTLVNELRRRLQRSQREQLNVQGVQPAHVRAIREHRHVRQYQEGVLAQQLQLPSHGNHTPHVHSAARRVACHHDEGPFARRRTWRRRLRRGLCMPKRLLRCRQSGFKRRCLYVQCMGLGAHF